MYQRKQRESCRKADGKQYISRSNWKNRRKQYILRNRQKTRTSIAFFILWVVAIMIFTVGLLSATDLLAFTAPKSNTYSQANGTPSPVASAPIFRVDGTVITNTQWHNAVQSAFSAFASSSQFLGGSSTDSDIINTQAMHSILDPLATQEITKELGLSTNVGTLYHQWLAQASLQELQLAQENQNNPNFQQQKAQEQMKKDIVNHFTILPTSTTNDVYTYYVQHPSSFARIAPQMHVQQIVVDSSQIAQKVVNQLKQGIPFPTVEASYDVSGAYYTERGGDLGWVTLGGSGFPPEWSSHVLLLHSGQIGMPFLVDSKYYIVKCINGPNYDPWPFSQVQEQARTDLLSEQLNTAFSHILAQHERSMKIVLLDQQYGTILQNFADMLKTE